MFLLFVSVFFYGSNVTEYTPKGVVELLSYNAMERPRRAQCSHQVTRYTL